MSFVRSSTLNTTKSCLFNNIANTWFHSKILYFLPILLLDENYTYTATSKKPSDDKFQPRKKEGKIWQCNNLISYRKIIISEFNLK